MTNLSLPNPVGKQREVLALSPQGHFVILGTAGSGKTTLAILRASMLSRTACSNQEKVLLVTFNKALVTYLKEICDGELKKVDVRNYHKFARGYLYSQNKIGSRDIIDSDEKLELIRKAIEIIRDDDGNSVYTKAAEVFHEEIRWIQRVGITDYESYRSATRVGRAGTRIIRDHRRYFYNVYQKYLQLRSDAGYKYDWDDLAWHVWNCFIRDNTARVYRHIVIDEGQDFSPVMLKSLVAAVPDDGSVTFFGDVAQQIYGSRITWRNAGLRPVKIWGFEENYRNTKEIAALGLAIAEQPFYKDVPDMVEPKFPKASGPKPTLVQFEDEKEELERIVSVAIERSHTQTVAVLVRDRQIVDIIISKLRSKRIKAQELHGKMSAWNPNPGISVGTYHSAKGLEFGVVLMPLCNKDKIPAEDRIIALEGEDEAMAEEARLIYVGVTRAKQQLLISYTGEITPILPADPNLYQRVVSG